MTIFIVLCVAMLVAALALIARPLIKMHSSSLTLVVLGILVPLTAVGLYWKIGHRNWERDEVEAQSQTIARQDLAANIIRLEQRIRDQPNDVDAIMSLGETLVMQDERTIAGRAGELFELALTQAPNNAKALWYGAIHALSAGQLPVARDRLQRMLVQNPPGNIRSIIERQIQDIDQQLGQPAGETPKVASGRALNVQVSIDPTVKQGIDKTTSLFILARDPINGGPPLAAVRRTAGDLPLEVSLSDNDAMMQGRGISSVPKVQIVARLSKSGTPQAQAGDLYGDATVEFNGAKPIAVKIVIDRKVEK